MSEAASGSSETRLVVAVALIVLISRAPALWLSGGGFLFSVDELELVRSVVDRFVGVPSTSLAWPASLVQFIGVVGVGVGAVLAPVTSPTALADYLSRLYLDSSGLLLFLRFISAALGAGVFAFYFACTRESGKGNLFSLGVAFVFAATPLVFIYSTQAVGDGPAFSLLLLSGLWLRGKGGLRREIAAGALFGLALACKFTAVLALPMILGMLLSRPASDRAVLQRLLAFSSAAGLALLLACPYLWLDPMRVAKSVLGNAGRGGDAMGLLAALWQLLLGVSAPMAVLGVLGLLQLAHLRRYGIAFGGAVSIVLLVAITANAGVVYDRYYLPGLVVAALLGLHAPWPREAGRIDKAFLTLCIAIFGLSNGLGYLMQFDASLDAGRARLEAHHYLAKLPHGTQLLLALLDLREFPDLASSKSLLRIADDVDRATLAGASRDALAAKAGMTPEVARVLAPAFSEDERALAARLRAMAGRLERPGIEVLPWHPAGARFGILTRKQALAIYRESQTLYLVTRRDEDCTDYLYLGREGEKIGDSCLYLPGEETRRD